MQGTYAKMNEFLAQNKNVDSDKSSAKYPKTEIQYIKATEDFSNLLSTSFKSDNSGTFVIKGLRAV